MVVRGGGHRKGQGCVPRCTVPLLFISLFFPPPHLPARSPAGAAQKGLARCQAPKKQTSAPEGVDKLIPDTLVISKQTQALSFYTFVYSQAARPSSASSAKTTQDHTQPIGRHLFFLYFEVN